MQVLAWSDALKTDIDVIDRQHRGLVDLVNAAAGRLAGGAVFDADEVRLLLGYLKRYAELHFGTEEALMALCGLPPQHTDPHHDSHARFLAQVSDLVDDLREGVLPDGRQLLVFLGDWLRHHIQAEDRDMARRMQAAQQSLAVARPSAGSALVGATFPFAEALARGSAALSATEDDVVALISESRLAALVIALDAALLPAAVVQANAAAANLFGRSSAALKGCPAASLFGPRQAERFPVLMGEVLVSGHYEGVLEYAGADAQSLAASARITHLVLQGQMAVLVVFDRRAERLPGEAPTQPGAHPAVADEGAAQGRTLLSRHALFHDLRRAELATLERATRLRRLHKGEVLFQRGDEPQGLYLVVSGQMSLVVANPRGAEKVIGIIERQQVFGEVEALTRRPYQMYAQSLAPSILLMIPVSVLHKLQATSIGFAAAVVAHLGDRLHQVIGEVEALSLHTAMERIVDHLLEHASINAHGVMEAVLPAQKQVIASYLNLSPPTLSRAFQQLGDAGLITITRRYVTIPDPERLLRFRVQAGVA